MRQRNCLHWMLLLGCLVLSGCSESTKPFRSAEDGFTIQFPVAPETTRRAAATPFGTNVQENFHLATQGVSMAWIPLLHRFNHTEIAYAVNCSRFLGDSPLPSNVTAADVVPMAIEAQVKYVKGELLAKRAVTIAGTAIYGREVVIAMPDHKHNDVVRIFWVNGRLYQVHVILPLSPMRWQDVNATRFLESFAVADAH